jgi:hypothetical protein
MYTKIKSGHILRRKSFKARVRDHGRVKFILLLNKGEKKRKRERGIEGKRDSGEGGRDEGRKTVI